MPVLTLECPDCGNVYKGTVLQGTKPPEVWICSRCLGGRSAQATGTTQEPHPWETSHSRGCACCA